MADATGFTEAGYVGEDVDLMLYRLLEASGYNLGAAQRGIVFLDEVDKLARSAPSILHGGKDVGGQGVQQALLKMIEGASVDVKDRRKGNGGDRVTIPFDTSSLLFIFSGAFNGLDEIVKDRMMRKSIGFLDTGKMGEQVNQASQIMSTDLVTFGLIPEFIGRIPVVARLEALDQHALERILTEPTGSLVAQYKELFAFHEVSLEFTDAAVSAIAALALRLEVGARGLRSILEGLLQDWMYEVPRSRIARIRIDAEVIEKGAKPFIEYRPEAKAVKE
jgi:ATP-dependent Clp protease ATP-binding subunit ClpX